MSLKRFLIIFCTVLSLLVFSGCGQVDNSGDNPNSKKINIVVGFYPLQFAAAQVTKDAANISNLTPAEVDPKTLKLSSAQIASLSKADIVIYQSGFQPGLDQAIADAKPKRIFDVAKYIKMPRHKLILSKSTKTSATPSPVASQGYAKHGVGENNLKMRKEGRAYSWLNPIGMLTLANEIGKVLVEIDPVHNEYFQQNTKLFSDELLSLDKKFATGLQKCTQKKFLTTKPVFIHLAAKYKLVQLSLAEITNVKNIDATKVNEFAAKEHLTTLFIPSKPATLKKIPNLKLKIDILDPIETTSSVTKNNDYLSIMNRNLAALKKANGCH